MGTAHPTRNHVIGWRGWPLAPAYHGITAQRLYGFFDWRGYPDGKGREAIKLHAGTYCISATMLQAVYNSTYRSWDSRSEREYRRLRRQVDIIFDRSTSDEQVNRIVSDADWKRAYAEFDKCRLGRLCAYLRQRRPDHMVGYTILIYRLDAGELESALFGSTAHLFPVDP